MYAKMRHKVYICLALYIWTDFALSNFAVSLLAASNTSAAAAAALAKH